MPKLLRLVSKTPTTQYSEATFECFLNDGIQLKPYSRIGLKTLVLPLCGLIVIDDSNDQFQLKCRSGDANALDIQLDQGSYLMQDFMLMFNNKIVEALAVNSGVPSQLGLQLQLYQTPETKTVAKIAYNRVNEAAFANATLTNLTAAAGDYSITTPGTPGNAIDTGFLIKGAGYLRTKVSTIGVVNMGLTSFFENAAFNPDTDYDFQLRIDGVGEYQYYNAATQRDVDTNVQAQADDVMSIEVCNRLINYVIYRAGNEINRWAPDNNYYDISLNYQPFIYLEGGTVASIPVYTTDPGWIVNLDGNMVQADRPQMFETVDEIDYGLGLVPKTSSNRGITEVTFTKAALMQTLGFASSVIKTINGSQDTLIGQNPIDTIAKAKSITIEIPSLSQLESYDTSLFKRRPILMMLPANSSYQNPTYVYDTVRPLMLDINNSQPILLRNMLVNIYLEMDGEENFAKVSDRIDMVVILDDSEYSKQPL